MHKLKPFLILLVCAFIVVTTSEAQYYYSPNGQVPLFIDSSKVTIKFDYTVTGNAQQTLLNSIERIIKAYNDEHVFDGFVACTLSTGVNYDQFLDSLDTLDGIYLVEPYYLTEEGTVNLVGDEFCVAFQEGVTELEIDSINDYYNVSIAESDSLSYGITLKNTDSTGYRLLDLANTYYNLSQTKFSHPNFITYIYPNSYTLYDHYHYFQYNIKKVIGDFNKTTVWDFAGLEDTVIIAILDMGIETHEDLPINRINHGYDYADRDAVPLPSDIQTHGMCCAGLIAASHTTDSAFGELNSSGIVSIAPYVNICNVKIYKDDEVKHSTITDDDLSDAIMYSFDYYRGNADVISCSWNFAFPWYSFDEINLAFLNAYYYGRGIFPDFKGCPIIFSSGNQGTLYDTVDYPANLPYCFSVGAVDTNDVRWDYSSYGVDLDVVAYSAIGTSEADIWTLDQMGCTGSNKCDKDFIEDDTAWFCDYGGGNNINYHCHFGGTSATAPVVAGIAALLIAKDSMLKVDEIYDILRNSAVKDLDWGTLPDTPHVEYGYGRVDAFRAILSISRGDVDNDDQLGVSDITALIDFLYETHTPPFPSVLLGDCNCDSVIDISDITHLVNFLYMEGPPPVKPCYIFELSAPPRLE